MTIQESGSFRRGVIKLFRVMQDPLKQIKNAVI